MRRLLLVTSIIIGILGMASCASAPVAKSGTGSQTGKITEFGYIDVTPQEAKLLIDQNKDLIIIDVSPAYSQGHLPGAVNYYFGDGSLEKAIPTLDKSKAYLVYCHSDSVSIAGAKKLVMEGFQKVYRLVGNYSGWVAAGYPVEK